MALYEHIFIFRQDISAEQVEKITKEISSLIENDGGKIVKTEYWGLRELAYKIKKNKKGHYTFLQSDADPKSVWEMERQMRIHDDVIRFLTVRVKAHDKDPSPILSQKDEEQDYQDDRYGGNRYGGNKYHRNFPKKDRYTTQGTSNG